jgi:hypothetical protein
MLASKWYDIFINRIHLLVPPLSKENDWQPMVGDVCLFVHQDPIYRKLWTWKLGVFEEQLTRSSYKISYNTSRRESFSYVQRAVSQISIIVPVDQLHINHPEFFKV